MCTEQDGGCVCVHGKLQQTGLWLSIRSDFKTVTFLPHSRVGAIKPVTLSGLSVCVCVCVCVCVYVWEGEAESSSTGRLPVVCKLLAWHGSNRQTDRR